MTDKGGLFWNKRGLLGDKAGLSKKGTHHFWMRPLLNDYARQTAMQGANFENLLPFCLHKSEFSSVTSWIYMY